MNPKFKNLVKLFQKLPGVGPRQGARFVLALMEKDDSELKEFGNALTTLKREIHFCGECFNIADNHLCEVCLDKKRDRSKVLVVEKVTDLSSFEKTGLYKGLYHVLGGAINPLDNITPDKLTLKQLDERLDRLKAEHPEIEVIVATNPSATGETTALHLEDRLKVKPGITLSRLARGLSSGSALEYADETTLRNALENRR